MNSLEVHGQGRLFVCNISHRAATHGKLGVSVSALYRLHIMFSWDGGSFL